MAKSETLSKIFDEGFAAFSIVEKNAAGFMNNPPNPHYLRKNTMFYKEWERGFNAAYKANQLKAA